MSFNITYLYWFRNNYTVVPFQGVSVSHYNADYIEEHGSPEAQSW